MSKARISFEVPFVAGKHRPRFGRHGVYTDPADHKREREILEAYTGKCLQTYGFVVRAAPGSRVRVAVDMWDPLPKSERKSVESAPYVKKPDGDNALKLVADALNGKAYHDDSQITYWACHKHDRTRDVTNTTRVTLWFEEIEEAEEPGADGPGTEDKGGRNERER